ncbi:MAG: YfhO family protein, partial [Clostridia bacterium]|nr:YfhO family protein [Clostridia bacterium]
MLLVYIAMGVFPFGKNSVLVLDLNGQYVYFFEALRSFIYGDSSLLYSFSRALGGEFLGIYAYYLASPLSYIVALFPKKCILEALFLMILTKLGLCGLSFGYMLKSKANTRNLTTIIFSSVYALSSYVVIMQHNTMWIDNVFMLPLIVLGVDSLISEGKYKLFVFSLTWAIMSNYYIGYMTCIFVFLYFFFSYFSRTEEKRNPRKKKLHFLRSLSSIALFSIISIAISAIILCPAYYSLTFGKTTFSDPTFEFVTKFDIFDLLTKFVFGAYDTVRPEGLPNVYCGIVTLILIPIYFTNGKITLREKICVIILSLILIFSFSINTLDLVWHGFQAPNWLNYRYSYMLSFIMVYIAARGFEGIKYANKKLLFFQVVVLSLFLLLLTEFEYSHVSPLITILVSLIIIFIYYGLFVFIISKRNLRFRILSGFVLAVISLEMFVGALYNTISLDYDVVISNRESYLSYMEKWEGATDYIKEPESEPFYRVEKTDYRKVNDSYTLGYRGLSGSTSTLNKDTVEFLAVFGYNSESHSSQYTGSTPMADSLLSIKYLMA